MNNTSSEVENTEEKSILSSSSEETISEKINPDNRNSDKMKASGKLTVSEIVIFGMLGAVIYASKLVMEAFPNVHLIGVFIVSLTVVYRKKALFPIYTFIFLVGLSNGFSTWWLPYLYIWAVLWGMTMLLPKNISPKVAPIVYMVVCSLHGFLYGTLYAPAQAILFGLDFKGMLAWIVAGLPWDAVHGVSNFFCGILIVPFIKAFRLADRLRNS